MTSAATVKHTHTASSTEIHRVQNVNNLISCVRVWHPRPLFWSPVWFCLLCLYIWWLDVSRMFFFFLLVEMTVMNDVGSAFYERTVGSCRGFRVWSVRLGTFLFTVLWCSEPSMSSSHIWNWKNDSTLPSRRWFFVKTRGCDRLFFCFFFVFLHAA